MRVVRKILAIILLPVFVLAAVVIVLYLYFDEKDFIKESGVIEEIEDFLIDELGTVDFLIDEFGAGWKVQSDILILQSFSCAIGYAIVIKLLIIF